MLTSVVANLISLVLVVLVALADGLPLRRRGARLARGRRAPSLFTLALTWLAVIPGLTAKSVDGVSGFSYPLIFLPFISSAFVPTAGMPGPVRWFAEHQPVTSIVDTMRDLSPSSRSATTLDRARLVVGLLVVAYALAMRTYPPQVRLTG